jgi:hypothetical protein
MAKDSKSTASLEEAVETTTNDIVVENIEVIGEEVISDTPSESKGESLKVKFLLSPVGKFGLAYSVDEIASLPENQANELVEAKYAEFVK